MAQQYAALEVEHLAFVLGARSGRLAPNTADRRAAAESLTTQRARDASDKSSPVASPVAGAIAAALATAVADANDTTMEIAGASSGTRTTASTGGSDPVSRIA